MNALLHALDGRLRLRISGIKKDPMAAASLERSVREVKGVKAVKASPVTGSVLILYDPWRIAQGDLLDLFGISVNESPEGEPQRNGGTPRRMLTEVLVPVLFEAACYYAVRRLFALPLRSL